MSTVQAAAVAPTVYLRGSSTTLADLIALRGALTGSHLPSRSPTAGGGARRARRRGRGVDFEEVRGYQPGDDVRAIDWRVTARTGKPHTKVFREERERPVISVIDLRQSMAFGSRVRFKSVAAVELAALIAWRALDAGDRSGGVIATDRGIQLHRPQRSRSAVLRLLGDLATASQQLLSQPTTTATTTTTATATALQVATRSAAGDAVTLGQLLQSAARIARPGSLCIIASDFHDLDANCDTALRTLARHCDVVCALVFDPIEAELPATGRYALQIGATRRVLDASSAQTRAAHRARFSAHRQTLVDLCHGLRITVTMLSTNESALGILHAQGPYHAASNQWPRQP